MEGDPSARVKTIHENSKFFDGLMLSRHVTCGFNLEWVQGRSEGVAEFMEDGTDGQCKEEVRKLGVGDVEAWNERCQELLLGFEEDGQQIPKEDNH